MMVSLKDRKWKDFYVFQIFSNINNSRAYHKDKLNIDYSHNGIAYITRTNKNNGLEEIVDKSVIGGISNSKNTLSLGAENATFFFQPYDYITGNKMYILESKKISKYIGLFLQLVLNSSLRGCGFGFSTGLTGARAKNRQFLLPINAEGEPDWNFMENYIKQIEDTQKEKYKAFALKKLQDLEYKEIPKLKEKQWKAFEISELFNLKRGKRLIENNRIKGKTPYYSASKSDNGLTDFISNPLFTESDKIIVTTFCDSYFIEGIFTASDETTMLSNNRINKYSGLFISKIISANKEKYSFGRKAFTDRISRQKIILPIESDQTPDYEYMEQYIKNVMYKQLSNYLVNCK